MEGPTKSFPVTESCLNSGSVLRRENIYGVTSEAEPHLTQLIGPRMEQKTAFENHPMTCDPVFHCDPTPPLTELETHGLKTQFNLSGIEKAVCSGQPPHCDPFPTSSSSKVLGIFNGQTPLRLSEMEQGDVIVGQKGVPGDSLPQDADFSIADSALLEALQFDILSNNSSDIPDLQNLGEIDMLEEIASADNLTSGVNESEAGVQPPVSTGKMGSQAFQYINDTAVLETDGIPALITSDYDGTYPSKPCGTRSVDPKLGTVPGKATSIANYLSDPSGTPCMDPKLDTVPEKNTIILTNLSYPFGTSFIDFKPNTVPEKTNVLTNPSDSSGSPSMDPKLSTVPEKATSITSLSNPCGTPSIDPQLNTVPENTNILTNLFNPSGILSIDPKLSTVPEKATSIHAYISKPCDNPCKDPELPDKAISATSYHSKPYGTVSVDTILTTLADKVPSTPDTDIEVCNTTQADEVPSTPDTDIEVCNTPKKKRQRRKRAEGEDGEERRVRMYEQLEPLSDQDEERKRKDAIRAKKCRDRKREEVNELHEKLKEAKKENATMAQELAARRSYEKALLQLLLDKHGIYATSFGSPSEKVVVTFQLQTNK